MQRRIKEFSSWRRCEGRRPEAISSFVLRATRLLRPRWGLAMTALAMMQAPLFAGFDPGEPVVLYENPNSQPVIPVQFENQLYFSQAVSPSKQRGAVSPCSSRGLFSYDMDTKRESTLLDPHCRDTSCCIEKIQVANGRIFVVPKIASDQLFRVDNSKMIPLVGSEMVEELKARFSYQATVLGYALDPESWIFRYTVGEGEILSIRADLKAAAGGDKRDVVFTDLLDLKSGRFKKDTPKHEIYRGEADREREPVCY